MQIVFHNGRVIVPADQLSQEDAVRYEMDYPGCMIFYFPVALEDVFQQMVRPKLLMEAVKPIRDAIEPKPILEKAFNKYHSMVVAVSLAWYKFEAEFEYSGRVANDEFKASITNWYKDVKIMLGGITDENVDQYNRPILVESQNWIEAIMNHAAEYDLASKKVQLDYNEDYPIIEGSEGFVGYITDAWDEACSDRKNLTLKHNVWNQVLTFVQTNDPNSYDGLSGLLLDAQGCIEHSVQNPFVFVEPYMTSIINDGVIRSSVPKTDLIDDVELLRVMIDGILEAYKDVNPDAENEQIIEECMDEIWNTYLEFLEQHEVPEEQLKEVREADVRWQYALVDDMIMSGEVCRIRLRRFIEQLVAEKVMVGKKLAEQQATDVEEPVGDNHLFAEEMQLAKDPNGDFDGSEEPKHRSVTKPITSELDNDGSITVDGHKLPVYGRGEQPCYQHVDEFAYQTALDAGIPALEEDVLEFMVDVTTPTDESLSIKFKEGLTTSAKSDGVWVFDSIEYSTETESTVRQGSFLSKSGMLLPNVDKNNIYLATENTDVTKCYVALDEAPYQIFYKSGDCRYTRPLRLGMDVDLLGLTDGDATDILKGPFGVDALVVKLQSPNDEKFLVQALPVRSGINCHTAEVMQTPYNTVLFAQLLMFDTPTVELESTGITNVCSEMLGTNKFNLEFEAFVEVKVHPDRGIYNVIVSKITLTKMRTLGLAGSELDLQLPKHAAIRDMFIVTPIGYYPGGERGNLNTAV